MIMSRSLAQKLNIRNQPFWITFGSAADTGTITVSKMNSHLIRMSSRLAARLRLSDQSSILAHFDPRIQRLRIGPLLGILINARPQENQEQAFGLMTKFLEECTAAGHERGIQVTVFPPEHVDTDNKAIQGWTKTKKDWTPVTLPFPDVIYNRLTSRKLEQQESVQSKLQKLKHTFRIPVFNETFLNKFQVYQILVKDDRMRAMLPETHPFRRELLKEMASRYPVLYLKPNNGSLGNGIIRLSHSTDKWVCQSAGSGGTLTQTARTLAEMAGMLARRIGRQSYIIQQGLHLIQYDNRQVDFRVLVQKNRQGQWQITSSVGRIAGDQHIVSNLARGGTMRKAVDVLNDLKNLPSKPSMGEIKMVALEIAKAFERLAEGHFAELGIDLAIDTQGKIWLIEINSKPSKTDDTVTNPALTTRPSVMRLLDYVLYLSGMDEHKKIASPSLSSPRNPDPKRGRPS
jgi:glutathione synthase/RimK-type ligase-like ATP-grasp enzyme